MSDFWSVSFRVASTQDKDARYAEVLASQQFPSVIIADVTTAHNTVWTNFSTNGEPTKPYAIYLWGMRDIDTGAFDIQTYVDLNP